MVSNTLKTRHTNHKVVQPWVSLNDVLFSFYFADARDSLVWLTSRIETNSEGGITGFSLFKGTADSNMASSGSKPEKSNLVGKSSIKYYAKMEEDSD